MAVPNSELLNQLLDTITRAGDDDNDREMSGNGAAPGGTAGEMPGHGNDISGQTLTALLTDIKAELQGINRNLAVLVSCVQGNSRNQSRRSALKPGAQFPFFMVPGVREELASVVIPPELEPVRSFLNDHDLYIVSAGLRRTASAIPPDRLRDLAGFIGENYGVLAPVLREIRRTYSADRYDFRFRVRTDPDSREVLIRLRRELRDLGFADSAGETAGESAAASGRDVLLDLSSRLTEEPAGRYFLTGGWLEVLARKLSEETIGELFEESPEIRLYLAANLAVRSGDEEDFEMDLFFLLNGLPFWIECKTGAREGWQEDLGRYRELAERYPVLGRNAFLLAADIEPEQILPLSRESGIRIVDIPSFKRVLRDSVLSDIASGDMAGNPQAHLRKCGQEPVRKEATPAFYATDPGFLRLREFLSRKGISAEDHNTIPAEVNGSFNEFAGFFWQNRSRLDHFDCDLRTALNGGDLEIPSGEIPDRHSLNFQFVLWLKDLGFISGYEHDKKKKALVLKDVKSAFYADCVSIYLWPAYLAWKLENRLCGRDSGRERPVILRRPAFQGPSGTAAEADLAVENGASWIFVVAASPDESEEELRERLKALLDTGISAEFILVAVPAPSAGMKARFRSGYGVVPGSPEETVRAVLTSLAERNTGN